MSTCVINFLCEDTAEALSLLSTVLAWGFRDSLGTLMVAFVGGVGGFGRSPGASALSSAPAALHLPASWLEVVLAPELLQWLLQALQCTSGPGGGTARHNGSAGPCSALAAPARSVLLQLCSIKGKAVQANEGAARARAAFCVHGLLAVRPCITAVRVCAHWSHKLNLGAGRVGIHNARWRSCLSPHRCASYVQVADPGEKCVAAAADHGAEDALLDVSQAILTLSRNVTLQELNAAVEQSGTERYLALVVQLSLGCIARGGVSVDNATEWQGQATSVHLLRCALFAAAGQVHCHALAAAHVQISRNRAALWLHTRMLPDTGGMPTQAQHVRLTLLLKEFTYAGLLLDAWVAMLQVQRPPSNNGRVDAAACSIAAGAACNSALNQAAALVFEQLLHHHLQELGDSAHVEAGAEEEVRPYTHKCQVCLDTCSRRAFIA